MSGGSMDYIYRQAEEAAELIRPTTLLRRAFRKRVRQVAEALRAIEWVDSCDSASGSEDEPIRACLGPGVVLAQAIEEADKAMVVLGEALRDARATLPVPEALEVEGEVEDA